MKKLIPIFLLILIASCKTTEEAAVGTYTLRQLPKTRLTLNSDKTFDFVVIQPNPYLHPFEHPDEYYFTTSGKWRLESGNKLILNSSSEEIKSVSKLRVDSTESNSESQFTFFDAYQDTIPLLFVEYTDGSVRARMHRTMPYFSEDLQSRDTLSFYFYGYQPLKFQSSDRKNRIYHFHLFPEYRADYFKDYKFRIRGNTLIDEKKKGRFKRKNNP